MTAMPKNLSNSTAELAPLTTLARALKRPRDYYQGSRHSGRGIPDNILLFHRRGAQAMLYADGSRHFHHRHVLAVPLQGRGRVVIDGRAFFLSPGRCALIAPYQFHHFRGFEDGPIDWLFITFEWKNPVASGSIFHPESNRFWSELGQVLRDYQSDFPPPEKGDRLACRLALLLADLAVAPAVRAENRTHASRGEDILLRVHALIAANMKRRISVDDIGRKLGVSGSHLRARFRQETGKSLGAFQREVRLQKAAEMLMQTKATVAEVSESSGWESPFAFSRAFRNYWGKSPKRFALFAKGRRS